MPAVTLLVGPSLWEFDEISRAWLPRPRLHDTRSSWNSLKWSQIALPFTRKRQIFSKNLQFENGTLTRTIWTRHHVKTWKGRQRNIGSGTFLNAFKTRLRPRWISLLSRSSLFVAEITKRTNAFVLQNKNPWTTRVKRFLNKRVNIEDFRL